MKLAIAVCAFALVDASVRTPSARKRRRIALCQNIPAWEEPSAVRPCISRVSPEEESTHVEVVAESVASLPSIETSDSVASLASIETTDLVAPDADEEEDVALFLRQNSVDRHRRFDNGFGDDRTLEWQRQQAHQSLSASVVEDERHLLANANQIDGDAALAQALAQRPVGRSSRLSSRRDNATTMEPPRSSTRSPSRPSHRPSPRALPAVGGGLADLRMQTSQPFVREGLGVFFKGLIIGLFIFGAVNQTPSPTNDIVNPTPSPVQPSNSIPLPTPADDILPAAEEPSCWWPACPDDEGCSYFGWSCPEEVYQERR